MLAKDNEVCTVELLALFSDLTVGIEAENNKNKKKKDGRRLKIKKNAPLKSGTQK